MLTKALLGRLQQRLLIIAKILEILKKPKYNRMYPK